VETTETLTSAISHPFDKHTYLSTDNSTPVCIYLVEGSISHPGSIPVR